MKSRYFIVCFNFANKTKNGNGNGYYHFENKNGKYPSHSQMANILVNELIANGDYGEKGDDIRIIFTNIIELSKEDYESWVS